MIVIAHRGMRSHAPENTMAAFHSAYQHGFVHVELDAMLLRDGTCVVFHDDELERTTDATGRVDQLNKAQLCAVDAGGWFGPAFRGERVPLLDTLMEDLGSRLHFHLELKSHQGALAATVATIVRARWHDAWHEGGACDTWRAPGLTITSFHLDQLQASRAALPDVRHAWLVQCIDEDTISAALRHHISQICPRADTVSRAAVARAHNAGLSVRVWGVKQAEALPRLRECGVEGATCDWPLDAQRTLAASPGAGPASAEEAIRAASPLR